MHATTTDLFGTDLVSFLVWQQDGANRIAYGQTLRAIDESEWTIEMVAAKLAWEETIRYGYDLMNECMWMLPDNPIPAIREAATYPDMIKWSELGYLGGIDAALLTVFHQALGYAILADDGKINDLTETCYWHYQATIAQLRECGALYPWEM